VLAWCLHGLLIRGPGVGHRLGCAGGGPAGLGLVVLALLLAA
jgi:hypothetical protein